MKKIKIVSLLLVILTLASCDAQEKNPNEKNIKPEPEAGELVEETDLEVSFNAHFYYYEKLMAVKEYTTTKNKPITYKVFYEFEYREVTWPSISNICEGIFSDEKMTQMIDPAALKSFTGEYKDLYIRFVDTEQDDYKLLEGTYYYENVTASIENGFFEMKKGEDVYTAKIIKNRVNGTDEFPKGTTNKVFKSYILTDIKLNGNEFLCLEHRDSIYYEGCFELRPGYNNFQAGVTINCIPEIPSIFLCKNAWYFK